MDITVLAIRQFKTGLINRFLACKNGYLCTGALKIVFWFSRINFKVEAIAETKTHPNYYYIVRYSICLYKARFLHTLSCADLFFLYC